MQKHHAKFHINSSKDFKKQMLYWVNQFSICCFMDSHSYEDKYHSFDCLLAVDAIEIFSPETNILQQLDFFYNNCNDWIFGHLSYDLKNEIEGLQSTHKNKIGFPDIFLFQPATVITLNNNEVEIFSVDEPAVIFESISHQSVIQNSLRKNNKKIKEAISKDEYINIINRLKDHIQRGDCYEINFCQEFFIDEINIDPVSTYELLIELSPTPFSCYYKLNDKYLFCASPERFLSKHKNKIFSQPIKGTASRIDNSDLDELQKKYLINNSKEKSENVMVVDVVRNDLSKICKQGSVITDELFGIYTFPQVHQMISTISGILNDDVSFAEIIKAMFPMGSMTGAPKYKVMQLIDEYEKTNRGLFSGSVGYITPNKDFDFNVVIRSMFYNATSQLLNYFVGSGITIYADAEKEYEECKLKAAAIEKVLA